MVKNPEIEEKKKEVELMKEEQPNLEEYIVYDKDTHQTGRTIDIKNE